MPNQPLSLQAMNAWIDTQRSRWMKDFFQFLSFPSISADPKNKQDILNCVNWLAAYLKEMNFDVELWPTPGHPVLFASHDKAGPNRPTLLIYNHYDVQPVDPLEEWLSPPFQPTLREGQVYARGAQDNKGQCFYVLQALKLLQDQTGSLPINIKLCIEGEEEMGSMGLSQVLSNKKKQLKADYLAVVDCGLNNADDPAVTLGMRGIVTLDIEVQGSKIDLHSGSHGGIVPNPIHALVQLLARLRDAKGKITIPGFYAEVVDISSEERDLVSFQFDLDDYNEHTGASSEGGEKDYSPLERAWIRPTLEINGIQGGYAGKGFKTVIPAKAHAKISCRLVPNQHPAQIGELVASFLRNNAPPGVEVAVQVNLGQGKAIRASPKAPIVQSFAKAFEEVFGKPCAFIFGGGSIPITTELAEACEGEVILLGLGLDTDQIHAPNEHFGLDRIQKGILIMASAIQNLSL